MVVGSLIDATSIAVVRLARSASVVGLGLAPRRHARRHIPMRSVPMTTLAGTSTTVAPVMKTPKVIPASIKDHATIVADLARTVDPFGAPRRRVMIPMW